MEDDYVRNLRSYGLPDSEVQNVPVAKLLDPSSPFKECPNCGCEQLMEIKVTVRQELIKGGEGVGTYIGCPACPFASPMMVVSHG